MAQHQAEPIRAGPLKVKNDRFGSWRWKTRWAVLTADGKLSFMKNETSSRPLMSIPLTSLTSISRVDDKPCCLLLTTTPTTSKSSAPAKSRRWWLILQSDKDLYDWQDDVYAHSSLSGDVSVPTDFVHRVHVGFDSETGAFSGVPDRWSALLAKSSITPEDYAAIGAGTTGTTSTGDGDVRDVFLRQGTKKTSSGAA